MILKNGKKFISLLLVIVMMLSVVPVQAFAAETDTAVHEHSEAAQEIQDWIDEMLTWYLGSTDATAEEIAAAVAAMDSDTIWMAKVEIADIEAEMEATLTEAEAMALVEENAVLCAFAEELDKYDANANLLATNSVLDGQVSIVNSNGTVGTVGTDSYVVSAEGGLIGCETVTLTITNDSGSKATLSFDYAVSGNYGSFTVAGTAASTSGSYSVLLDNNASVTVVVAGKRSYGAGKATLTLSNISLAAAASSSNVTFEYDSTLGSITVGGSAVTSGDSQNVSLTDGASLMATPNSGVTFLGWINEADGTILSTAASYTLTPAADMTVRAVFVGANSKPWFMVGTATQQSSSTGLFGMSKLYYYTVSGAYLFDDLNAAATAASSGTSKYIVLMNSGTLAAGTYTIPSGVTLLIPFDSANTLYTTDAESIAPGSYSTPTAYRTLTLANGANLVINGSMSLSAKHCYASGSKANGGSPTGSVSFVQMESGSNITVNNGGVLYAYGFITGSGSVTANSGAKVYENFQIMDFRGGNATTSIENGVFPLSQYYVQNIEVPLTLYAGAKEYSYTTIYMQESAFASSVDFIASSNAMFNLTSGYVVKRYDGTTDRLIVEAYGNMEISPIKMSVGTATMDTANYVLPINSNITVKINDGSTITIKQDVAMLPGSEIIIAAGATCTLSSDVNVYIYDADEWGGYVGPSNKKFIPLTYAPGRTHTRTEADLVDASILVDGTVDASAGYIYTTTGGANIHSTGSGVIKLQLGTDTVTYQAIQSSNEIASYAEIPIVPAKLKNADGSYLDPNEVTNANTFVYSTAEGAWRCEEATHSYTSAVTTAATCETAGVRTYTCPCGHSYTEAIPATGHTPGAEATCTTAQTCTVCGAELAAAKGHTAGAEATCTTAQTCTVCGAELAAAKGHTAGADATCTTAQTCTVCGEELAAALGHSWKDAACTAPKTCTVCGETEGEALGHSWVAADCTTPKTCSVCGETEGEALGHSWVAADCTTPKTCSVCGETEGEALGHSWVEATCTSAKACTVCGETEGEALGHSWVAADCDTPKTCSVCGETEGEALGHNYNSVVTAPTCTAQGYTTYTCSRCNDSYVGDYVDATGHTAGDSATCTAAQTCTVCGAELAAALGHDYEAVVTAPTCEAVGYTTYICSRCGDTYTGDEVAATGHTAVTDAAVEATCTETGLTEGSHCSVCNETLVAQTVVPAKGHTEVTDEAKAPTCTETGLTAGSHCSVCNEVLVAQEVISAKGHSWTAADCDTPKTCSVCGATEGSAAGHTSGAEATCTTAQTCTVCGEVLTEALGHSMTKTEAKEATCTEAGNNAYYTCGTCGKVFEDSEGKIETTVDDETIAAPGHQWTAATCTAAKTCDLCGATDGEALGHSWVAATCTTAKTCTVCGATEGDALGHKWVDATCMAPKTCSVCKATEGEALGHDYEAVVTASTCTEQGYTTYSCSRCNDSYVSDYVAAKGHTAVVDAAKAPTCTDTGLTEGSHCSVCKEVIVAQTVVAAKGHTAVTDAAVEATCTETGLTEGSHCSVCNEVLVAQEEIPALGHTPVIDAAKTPSCTETGLTEGSHCSVCSEVLVAQEEIPALGHTPVTDAAVEATCTRTGLTEGSHCSVCSEVLVAQETVAALGHTAVTDAAVAPTCTETGLTEGSHCSVCGETIIAQQTVPATGHKLGEEADCTEAQTCTVCGTELEAALGHDYSIIVVTAPTCTQAGYTTHTCARCGDSYTSDPSDALGHTAVTDAAVEATCTETGLTEGSHCSVCNEVLVAQETVAALGHKMTRTEAKAATCMEDGNNEYYICETCSKVFKDAEGEIETTVAAETIAATGHTAGAEATCTTAQTCTVCGEELAAATGHTAGAAATCTTAQTCTVCGEELAAAKGHTAGAAATCTTAQTCTVCGEVLTAALGHDYAAAVTAPSCTAQGYTTHTCSRCGNNYTDSYLAATGHSAGDPATCTTAQTCTVCGTELKAALGHSMTKTEAKAASCTEAGNNAYYTCGTCSKAFKDSEGTTETTVADETIAALGHDKVSHEAKEPSCTEYGWKAYETCNRCDYSTYEEIEALGHKMTKTEAKVASCTENGNNAYYTCETCNKVFKDAEGKNETSAAAEVIAAKGHTAGAAATCTTAQSCTVCGTELVKAKGHTAVTDAAVAPTCIKTGLTEGSHCSVCNEVLTAQETVAALGHDYVGVVTAPTCTAQGYTTHTCSRCSSYYTDSYVAATGHSAGDPATCTTAQTCTVCGTVLKTATGHTVVTDAAKAPTCTETGLTEGSHCSVCNEVLTAQETVPALGHKMTKTEAKAATCTEAGNKEYYTCEACGKVYKDAEGETETTAAAETIAATGHTAGAAATCTAAQTCTVCGAELAAALGHDMAAATCTAPATCKRGCGYAEGEALGHTAGAEATCTTAQTCTVCGDVLAEALGHSMTKTQAKEATCTEDGNNAYYTCGTCGKVFQDAEGKTETTVEAQTNAALGHTAGAAATCTTAQTCTVCGDVVTEALGHSMTKTEAKAASCTKAGNNAYYTCETCGKVFKDSEGTTETTVADETNAALGHDKVSHEAKDPSCTEYGWKAYETCNRCDYSTYEEIEALGHKMTKTEAKVASCTENGNNAYYTCETCSKVFKDAEGKTETSVVAEVIAAKDHTAGAAATCTAAQTCTVCGTELAAALGHNMAEATCTKPVSCQNPGCTYTEGKALGHVEVIDEEMPALCEDTGLTEGSHCSVCGEVLVAQKVIAALGHDIKQYEAKNPTYTGVGWEAYEACTRCAYSTYVEIPALDKPVIEDYETFMTNLALLEELAASYAAENPGKDPAALVIKYIRTGVDRYNSGSWGIMAGYEDEGFAKYVSQIEDEYNSMVESQEEMLAISSLKDIENFYLPNGDYVDMGHVFGMMDITYHNGYSLNHADVAGWAGDLVDLLSLSDQFGVSGTLDEMVVDITENYLLKSEFPEDPVEGTFSQTDMYGDLDGYYIMQQLSAQEYESGTLHTILQDYFIEDLTVEDRVSYFLKNRLDGATLRGDIRTAVYNAYTSNKMVATLEDTREFTSDDLVNLKKACCYAFADYLCKIAGDYVEVTENPYYDVFSSESSTLAPGITQDIKFALSADGKQMAYYIATADLNREDVHIFANYNNNDPAAGWAMQRVLDQANAAQAKYGDPESEYYIENYNVITSINGAGYNMSTGEPGGLLVMNGVEYHSINANGFFGILKDGTAVIGTTEEYNTIYKDQVQEGIAGFGSVLVKDGKVCITATGDYYENRASRTAVGITKTGKVVFMVLDGRQEPFSCGGSMEEIAQIMLEAGCVHAINLDGGGSSTYVAKQEGSDELSVINSPSDGSARSVSTSLIMVSTAPSSTAFDHAILETKTNYLTVGSSLQITAEGVSATGNAADIPEGTTWAVSDERWASITEDGVFTALRNGDVDVYLMLGDEIIGSKTMHIVIPNNVYFTKSKIDAVYGEKVELPVKVLYDGKEVTVQASDLIFTLDNPAAGTIEGFVFTGDEAGKVRTAKITVALANNTSVTASISVALYNQGEASFDFEQATGGDRELAWDRQVSNSTTEDAITYYVVNPDEDMVTSYIFAIDMTQIPIPQQLEDLTYMLPGSDVEGASAWTFLLQLAQRVSVLTEVRPVIRFDPNFDVDYSGLTLVNEYFGLEAVELDEETNTLTLTLRWKKQTQAIDPNEANPMCIVSGIKLTPKEDAAWSEKGSLTAVHSGEVGYEIYLRASSLYTFAQKPENQETFGLLPFVNPDDPSEAGAYFGDIYKEFEDTYTLVRVLKNGWVNEDGGFAYYVDGIKYTGIQQVDGYYYDFGENGINVGQTKYTGLFWDDTVNAYRYAQVGKLTCGWKLIDGQWHHFWEDTYCATVGTYDWTDVYYTFDETGRLISGVWKEMDGGTRYYYGPSYYQKTWATIDGDEYYFDSDGYRCEGYQIVKDSWTNPNQMYHFTDEGVLIEKITSTGLLDTGDKTYYLIDGIAQYGLYKIDGYYYYFNSSLTAVTGTYYINQTNGLLPQAEYVFDEEGRMVITKNGLVQEEDGLYYYVDGARTYAGLIEIDGDYYYINSKCKAVTGVYYAYKNNDLMPQRDYTFGDDGKMIFSDGLHEIRGELYYYEGGKLTYAGLIKLNGYYYYINSQYKAVTGTYYVNKNNGLMPQAEYQFADDSRMLITGLVEDNGELYYYENGELTYAGLIKIDGYYYYINSKCKAVTGTYYISKTNGIMAQSNREFDADGKMILNGLVEENGGLYYYQNGKLYYAGLIQIDGYYYYINSKCKAVTGTYYVNKNNGLMPQAEYQFADDGKMILSDAPDSAPDSDPTPEPVVKDGIVTEDGVMYYYVNGVKTYAGLIQIDGDYYYVNSKCIVVTGVYYISKNNGLMPQAEYQFAEDGKMIGPVTYS